jgi:hypothetical protein
MKIRAQLLLLCGSVLLAVGTSWCEQFGGLFGPERQGTYRIDDNGRRVYGRVIKRGTIGVIFEDEDGIEDVIAADRVKECGAESCPSSRSK